MAARIASISGVFLEPGVSRNNRYYSPAVVKAAVENMKQRLANGDLITMATSHAAGRTDDALHTAGAVREVWVDENNRARFRADVPDTTTGRDAIALLRGKYAGGVSIDGEWFNVKRTQTPDGKVAEAGENLHIRRIDLTGERGVQGAGIDHESITESVQEDGSVRLHESSDAPLLIETGANVAEADDQSIAAPAAQTTETTVTEKASAATEEAKPVSEAAAAAPAAVELSESTVKALAAAFAEAIKPAPVEEKPVAEAAAPAPEATPLTESSIRALVAEEFEKMKAELRDDIKQSAFGGRKGLATSESAAPSDKPLERMTHRELQAARLDDSASEVNRILALAGVPPVA